MGAAALLIVAIAARPAAALPTHTQTFTLHPGWNSIYLEVAPQASDPASVFGALPLLSVWSWNPKSSVNDFIQEPSEAALTQAGWLGYFPPGPFSALTNLFLVQANRAYLVRIGGTSNVALTVTGRPSVRETRWSANALNLVGFHVDPGSPPTFAAFFASSPAHAGQAIYRLGDDGLWAPLPASTPIQSGEAYWVYCSGSSVFTAPTWVDVGGDGLDYAMEQNEAGLTIRNASGATNVALGLLSSSSPVPLTYWRLSPSTNTEEWPSLPSPLSLLLPAQGSVSVRLAVKRINLTGSVGESILEVKDGRGTRILVPVQVEKLAGVSRGPGPDAPTWRPTSPGAEGPPRDSSRRTDR